MPQHSGDLAQARGATSTSYYPSYEQELAALSGRPAETGQPSTVGARPTSNHSFANVVNAQGNTPLRQNAVNGGVGYGVASSQSPPAVQVPGSAIPVVDRPSVEWTVRLQQIQAEAYRRGVNDGGRSREEAYMKGVKEGERSRDEVYEKRVSDAEKSRDEAFGRGFSEGFSEGFQKGFDAKRSASMGDVDRKHITSHSSAALGTLSVATGQTGTQQNRPHLRPQISPSRRYPDDSEHVFAAQNQASFRSSVAASHRTAHVETQNSVRPQNGPWDVYQAAPM